MGKKFFYFGWDFFSMSGVFTFCIYHNKRRKKWLKVNSIEFIISRIKTLLVPYLFLDITGGIYMMILSNGFSFKTIYEIIKNTITFKTNVGPNWFLPAMFIANILFYYFMKYYKDWFKYIVFIPILLLGFNCFDLNSFLIFIFRGIIGFTFLYIGYALKKYFLDDYNKRCDILIVAFIMLIAIMKWNGQIELWSCCINNPFFMILGGIVGTFLIFGIAKHIDNRLFQFIGNNTITFMATHCILIVPLHNLLKLHNGNRSLIFLFLSILVLEIPIMYIYNRFFPKLIGKK